MPDLLQYYLLRPEVYLSRCCRLCCRRRTSPAATATKNHAKEKSKNSPGLSTASDELDAFPADAGTSAADGPSNSSASATVAGAAADAAGAESDAAAGGTASSPAASARSDAFIVGVKAVVVCGGSAAAVLAGGTTAGGAAPGAAAAGRSAIASAGAAGASNTSGSFARLTPVGAAEFTVLAAIIWACATTSAKFPFNIHI